MESNPAPGPEYSCEWPETTTEDLGLPINVESAERMRAGWLRPQLVDTSDGAAFGHWLEADSRGFHQPRPSAESLAAHIRGLADRRTTSVVVAVARAND